MADNVTPFRRPAPKPVRPQQSGGLGFKTHRGKAVLVHLLVLASFAAPFLLGGQLGRIVALGIAIAAAVIAYSSRAEATPWAATHHEQALRTLMFAYVVLTVLSLPSFVVSRDLVDFWASFSVIYFWTNIVVLIWVLIRSGVGLVLASLRKAIPHPRGLLL
jgi:uncharacterized membrane protein